MKDKPSEQCRDCGSVAGVISLLDEIERLRFWHERIAGADPMHTKVETLQDVARLALQGGGSMEDTSYG